jgi:hypothetical protein
MLGSPVQFFLHDLNKLFARLLAAGALYGALFAFHDFAANGTSPLFHRFISFSAGMLLNGCPAVKYIVPHHPDNVNPHAFRPRTAVLPCRGTTGSTAKNGESVAHITLKMI